MSTDRVSLILHSFGPSFENVTHLTLGDVILYPLTLAVFVSHFPHLDDLSISSPGFRFPVAPDRASCEDVELLCRSSTRLCKRQIVPPRIVADMCEGDSAQPWFEEGNAIEKLFWCLE